MNRAARTSMARQTVGICEAGFYTSPNGNKVSIGAELEEARRGTIVYSLENRPTSVPNPTQTPTRLTVRNETTFSAISRLARNRDHVACLNFASAKNPGGGFLNGSVAQEEALACSSGLYPCLLAAPEYYERNRANRSALYLDLAIFSPLVPFFRDDSGNLLDTSVLASVITAPAPNAGAIAQNEPSALSKVSPTLQRRAEQVLEIAQAHKVDNLVLGAWGCGVFRNDPRIVAKIFGDLLNPSGKFVQAFTEVSFAVYDLSDEQTIYRAFAEQFH